MHAQLSNGVRRLIFDLASHLGPHCLSIFKKGLENLHRSSAHEDQLENMFWRLFSATYISTPWEIFSCFFLLSADCFQNQLFRKNSFRKTIRVSNSLDPDHSRHYVGPGLGPNCLQRLPADDTSRLRVKSTLLAGFH